MLVIKSTYCHILQLPMLQLRLKAAVEEPIDRQTAVLRWLCVVGGGGKRVVDGAQRNNNTLHSQDYPDRNVFIC